jgi:hypothetical protein
MTWTGWHATFIRNGDIKRFHYWNTPYDFTDLIGANLVSHMQLVLSADGEEAIISSTDSSPKVQAISTTTGETLWSHDVYPVDNQNRSGELIGSPRAGRYLWRDTQWNGQNDSSYWNYTTGYFGDFTIDPASASVDRTDITVWAGWQSDAYPYDPRTSYDNGVLIETDWSGNIDTLTGFYGNLAYGANQVSTYPPWQEYNSQINTTGIAITTPPQTGAHANLSITGQYSSKWSIQGAMMTVYFTPLGTADSSVIELRDETGAVLDTITNDHASDNLQWVALQPGMNAYARFGSGGGGGPG